MSNATMAIVGDEANVTPAELGWTFIRWGLGLFITGFAVGFIPILHYMVGAQQGDVGPVFLKNVTLSVDAREIRAICGENGAGKSTLVKVFTGVHQVDEGVVLVDGKPTAIPSPQRAQELGIALVAQELSLAPALSVLHNIWLGNREVPLFHRRKSLRNRARAALEKVGLGDLPLETPVSQLSIGRREAVRTRDLHAVEGQTVHEVRAERADPDRAGQAFCQGGF